MRDRLCQAFCDELLVRKVPAGLAVSTVFSAPDGDRIAFYVVSSGEAFRIEDDGLTLPTLEASGVDFSSGTRAQAMTELLGEYGVAIDDAAQEFYIDGLREEEVPAAALKFAAFSLRIRDFVLMTEQRVASTFRDDAAKAIREAVGDRALVEDGAYVTPRLTDFQADFVVRAVGRPPVGVFLGMSDQRVLEALFLHLRARHEVHEACSIVALLEYGRSISARVRQQAVNRLDAVPEFRGEEQVAAQRIANEALGETPSTH